MLSVDLGAVVTLTATSSAAGAATVTVTGPDGAHAPTVTDAGTSHSAPFTPAVAGRYLVSWVMAGQAAYTDVLNVWPTDPRFLISLGEARAALKKTIATAVDDDSLRLFISAATPIIEDICGPILAGTRTQTASGNAGVILLGDTDVSSVVVRVDGVVTTTPTVNAPAGVITPTGDTFGGTTITVTYSVGGSVVPENVRLATTELVRSWWASSRQGARGAAAAAENPQAWTPSGFRVPSQVLALCAPTARLGGFG